MTTRKNFLCLAAFMIAMVAANCTPVNLVPKVEFSSAKPLIHADPEVLAGKRAMLLGIKEPVNDKGVGNLMGALLFDQFLQHSQFTQMQMRSDLVWWGLQSSTQEEFSSAAAIGAREGVDIVILGQIERFVYSRNQRSSLVVYLWLIDTATGEMLHAQRITATGKPGYIPPIWDPSLNTPVESDDLFMLTANELVLRLFGISETKEAVDVEEKLAQ
jgi:hypothetical protein